MNDFQLPSHEQMEKLIAAYAAVKPKYAALSASTLSVVPENIDTKENADCNKALISAVALSRDLIDICRLLSISAIKDADRIQARSLINIKKTNLKSLSVLLSEPKVKAENASIPVGRPKTFVRKIALQKQLSLLRALQCALSEASGTLKTSISDVFFSETVITLELMIS